MFEISTPSPRCGVMAGWMDIGFGSLIGGVFIVLSLYLQLFDGRWEQGEGKGKEEVENKTI